MEKEPTGDVALMPLTFASPSYGTNTEPYHRIKQKIVKWIAADCLAYKTMETRAFRGMTRSLDLKCPEFGSKSITSQVVHCPEYYLVFVAIFNMFFPITEVANAITRKWKLWRARLEK